MKSLKRHFLIRAHVMIALNCYHFEQRGALHVCNRIDSLQRTFMQNRSFLLSKSTVRILGNDHFYPVKQRVRTFVSFHSFQITQNSVSICFDHVNRMLIQFSVLQLCFEQSTESILQHPALSSLISEFTVLGNAMSDNIFMACVTLNYLFNSISDSI